MDNKELQTVLQRVSQVADFADVEVTDVKTRGLFGDTPLHVAAVWGDVDAGKILLRAGADPNAIGENGNTPLHEAVTQGNSSFVQLLLESSADRGIRNNDGRTPLELAEVLHDSATKEILSRDWTGIG